MQSGLMPRRNEGFMALAYCLRRLNNKELRKHIYANIGEVMITDVDLFMFVKYATLLNVPDEDDQQSGQKITKLKQHPMVPSTSQLPRPSISSVPDADPAQPQEPPAQNRGFGRGMKRAISQWYTSKTASELADIMGRRRGLYRWTHRDLFKLCHIKFDDTQQDKVQIMKAMFNRGVKVLREMDRINAQEQPTGNMIRLCQIFRFKMCEDATDGANMFIHNGFDMDQVPSHFLADPKFWILSLPQVPYTDVLRILLTLHGYGMLGKHPLLKRRFLERLGNQEQIRLSGVQPLQMLSLINGYKAGQRYPEAVKVIIYI